MQINYSVRYLLLCNVVAKHVVAVTCFRTCIQTLIKCVFLFLNRTTSFGEIKIHIYYFNVPHMSHMSQRVTMHDKNNARN